MQPSIDKSTLAMQQSVNESSVESSCSTDRQNRDFSQSLATNGSGFSGRCGSTDLAGGPTALATNR